MITLKFFPLAYHLIFSMKLFPFLLVATFFSTSSWSFGSNPIRSSWKQLGNDINGEWTKIWSGCSVSLSADGQVVAIGAKHSRGDNSYHAGRVRVYHRMGDTWEQRGADINGEVPEGYTGSSLSLSADGRVVAIGSPFENNGGSVRVYYWDGDAWQKQGSGISVEGYTVNSLSLSADGRVVAIGSPFENNSGSVRVYHWDGDFWQQRGAGISGERYTGWSVSLSANGQVVAIGGCSNNNVGCVRVYHWGRDAWEQRGADIFGENFTGISLSLSANGQVVAIGGCSNDNRGYVGVYQWDGDVWQQRGAHISGESASDFTCNSVSLSASGQTVAIGSPGQNNYSGNVRFYRWVSDAWKRSMTNIKGEAHDESGSSLSLSANGQVVAIGAPGNNFYAGSVRVYTLSAD